MKKTICEFVGMLAVVIAWIILMCVFCGTAHAESKLVGKTIVVENTTKKEATKTAYTIEVNGKRYVVYRGPRGGYYYMVGDKKVYLTKEQKALIK